MTAHGADPQAIDEETFTDICVMFNDGLIGNLGILEVLGTLTAGQFNKVLSKGSKGYKLKDIIPQAYDYLYPPQTEQEKKELDCSYKLGYFNWVSSKYGWFTAINRIIFKN